MSADWTTSVDTLSGDLVTIREVCESDAPTLFELLADPAVSRDMSNPPPSLDAFRGFIRWARRERENGRSIALGIVVNGLDGAVGIIQIRAQEPSWLVAEWGFAIGAAFWGTGAFYEAANLAAGFAFDRMGVHRLEARAVVGNGRGNGVLQKLGARAEGTLAAAFNRGDRFDAQLLWGLNAEDWRQRPATHSRFSLEQVCAQIAEAIRDTEQRTSTQPRTISAGSPALHPFFIRGNNRLH